MRVLAIARPNRMRNFDDDINDTDKVANGVAAGKSLIRELDRRVQDFGDFLPKLEWINRLVLYKSRLSSFSDIIIFVFIINMDSSLNNISYIDLAMIYLCYFCFHTVFCANKPKVYNDHKY